MDNNLDATVAKLKAAADAANDAANAAHVYADQLAAAAHAASGGVIDPFVFRLASAITSFGRSRRRCIRP